MKHRQTLFTKPSIHKPGIDAYAQQHTTPPSSIQAAIAADTSKYCPEWENIATTSPQVGLLQSFVRTTGTKRVLDLGTFAGRSAEGMAAELPDDGQLITIDSYAADQRARTIALKAFAASPHGRKITLIERNAFAALNSARIVGEFGVIFVDADKPNYLAYYETIMERELLAPGGVLVFDNTLWGGTVLDPPKITGPLDEVPDDQWPAALMAHWCPHVIAFNDALLTDDRVNVALLTVGDGMTIVTHRAP